MKSIIKVFLAFAVLTGTCFAFTAALENRAIDTTGGFVLPGGKSEISVQSTAAGELRTLPEFDSIHVPGSGNVRIRFGSENTVLIKTSQQALSSVRTQVHGDTLSLIHSDSTPVEYEVSLVRLEDLKISGSASVQFLDELTGDDFSVTIAGSGNFEAPVDVNEFSANILGSGNVRVSGKTEVLELGSLGSGNLFAENLNGVTAEIRCMGSGNMDLGTFEEIEAFIAGTGTLTYTGNPEIDARTPGTGKIMSRR